MAKYHTPRQASEILGVGVETLRRWDKERKIKTVRTAGQTRLYDISDVIGEEKKKRTTILYCRVSSAKQKEDLKRQIEYVSARYPKSEVVKDVGSGINFKRKGLNAILERAMSGEQLEVVVAYKDRLARFGYELVEGIISRNGGKVVVLNEVSLSPSEELTQDLLTILHVFSCRLCGIRKYREKIKEESNIKEDTGISDTDTEIII